MSRLLLDVGNTQTKWRIESMQLPSEEGAFPTSELVVGLASLSLISRAVTVAVISWVGDQDRKHEVESMLDAASVDLVYVSSRPAYEGLVNGYEDPSRLGVDRWLALMFAWKKYKCNCVVVDAGTALTIDCVDGDGRHLGGYIVPGILTQIESLNRGTQLIDVSCPLKESFDLSPGRNTRDAVSRGVLVGVSAMVNASFQRFLAEYGVGKGVITGGHAHLIFPHLEQGWCHEPSVMLDALSLYADSIGC